MNEQDTQLPWDTIEDVEVDETPPTSTVSPYVTIQKSTSAWTIPLMCAGIALIACCLLIPSADENRRLAYEGIKLKADLEQLERQVSTNDEFLKRVADDPTLAERLAQRQMKMVREGTAVLELKSQPLRSGSPFQLVTLPPPAELPPYRAVGGTFAQMCRQPKAQLYFIGSGLLMLAIGVVLGHGNLEGSAPSEPYLVHR